MSDAQAKALVDRLRELVRDFGDKDGGIIVLDGEPHPILPTGVKNEGEFVIVTTADGVVQISHWQAARFSIRPKSGSAGAWAAPSS